MGSLFFKIIKFFLKRKRNSWLYSVAAMFGLRAFKAVTKKKELIDISSSKPGSKFVIEHLPISHAKQIKAFKKDKRAQKKLRRKENRVIKKK